MVRAINKSFGVFGGSFDPVHKGHLKISKIAIKKLKLDKILWLVTKKNPFKNQSFYSLTERVKNAKKMVKNEKKIKVISLDKIINTSRSINVINYLVNKKKLKNIYFIIGLIILLTSTSGKVGKK